MKRIIIVTSLTCAAILGTFFLVFRLLNLTGGKEHMTVGFIYDNDESTPYTYNFSLAKDAIEKKYGKKVDILTCSNVLDDEMEEPLRELVAKGCDIIFLNGYSEIVREVAPEYPNVQLLACAQMIRFPEVIRKARLGRYLMML